MKAKSNILCVFEGESREGKYFKTLKSVYFNEQSMLVCCYGNDVYELYKELKADEDLDIVEVLRESKDVPTNSEILDGYERDDFNQVFLFFDIECQDNNFSSDDFIKLLEIFDEETENGKLFISYPMIEAIRDIPAYDMFLEHKVAVENCTGKIYKQLSTKGVKDFTDPRHDNRDNWDKLVRINVEKGNFIVSGKKDDLVNLPEQLAIAEKQVQSINETNTLYVLSAYPLFVFHQNPAFFTPPTDE